MLTHKIMDITSVQHGIVGHGCNCSGGFGSGVAGAVKKVWPVAAEGHATMGVGAHLLGTTHIICIRHDILYVANMYTQVRYGSDGAKYASESAIATCMEDVASQARIYDLPLYVPKIGSGLGGLNYETDVLPIYEDIAERYEAIDIIVCDIA